MVNYDTFGVMDSPEERYGQTRERLFAENKAKNGYAGGVSRYAKTNAREWFAESFAAYTHPGYAKSKRKIDARLEKLFDIIYKGKKP